MEAPAAIGGNNIELSSHCPRSFLLEIFTETAGPFPTFWTYQVLSAFCTKTKTGIVLVFCVLKNVITEIMMAISENDKDTISGKLIAALKRLITVKKIIVPTVIMTEKMRTLLFISFYP
jgi:hypothetical protein